MTDTTPGGFADTPGPDATAEQDADVRALLSFLRDEPLEMPADVRARLEAVLAEERRTGFGAATDPAAALADASSGRAATTGPVTVLPTGASRRGPSSRAFRIVGGLAAAALVVFGGVAVLNNTGGGSSTSGSAESAASASASVAASAAGTRVTASGTSYSQASLAAQARTLATAARSSSSLDAKAAATPVPAAPSAAPVGGTAYDAFTAGNVTVCVRAITEGDGSVALAVDSGSYAGHPAVVVVVPTQGDPASLDVFVVKPGCATGSADILEFQRIPAS